MNAHNPAEVHELFLDAFNRGDVEAIVALYEPNAVLIDAGQPLIGHTAIREFYRNLSARKGRMRLETQSLVEWNGSLAVLHGSWTFEFSSATAKMTTNRGISTEVVHRRANGTWLFVIDEPCTCQMVVDEKSHVTH